MEIYAGEMSAVQISTVRDTCFYNVCVKRSVNTEGQDVEI